MNGVSKGLPRQADCWNSIGISGDGSCPELEQCSHCRNCSYFISAGRALLDRPPPDDYVHNWALLLAKKEETAPPSTRSVVFFRLSEEWFALATELVREVTPLRCVHRVPHRSGKVFRGLVNIRGELQLAVSLHGLLAVEAPTEGAGRKNQSAYARMAVIEREGAAWAFQVDEMYGIHRFPNSQTRSVPATVSRTSRTFTKGLIDWGTETVGLLDEELLFSALARSMQ